MASNKIDARQSRLTSAQGMLGSLSGDTLDTIFPKINDEIAKLFEDRNLILSGGGTITVNSTGTSVTFSASLELHVNSKVAGGSPSIIDLTSNTRTFTSDGNMLYAIINRTAATATVTADSSTLPAVTSANQEVVLLAKRIGTTIYFRNGAAFSASSTGTFADVGSVIDSSFVINDDTDPTKQIAFDASGTTGTKTTILSSQTANRVITLPNISDTLASRNNTETLSQKQLRYSVSTDSVTTGSIATLQPFTTGIIRLTNPSLVSVAGIPAGSLGQILIIENKTGTTITIGNEDVGASAANRILTGTGGTITMLNDATFTFTYDSTSSRWQLTGGSGSGSGSGIVNYITYGSAEAGTQGWLTYADAASARPTDGVGGSPNITWTTTNVNPLSNLNSYLFTKDAANRQGQGVAYQFTIDNVSKAKSLKISFDYIITSGTFAVGSPTTDSDLIVYIYDITNSKLIEPSNIKLFSNDTTLSDKFEASFQTSLTGSSYRLIFHQATTTTAAFALKIDNIVVTPATASVGLVMSDDRLCVQGFGAITGTTSNPTFATPFLNEYRVSRVGDKYHLRGALTTSGTGNAGSGDYIFTLPDGMMFDSTKTRFWTNVTGFSSFNSESAIPAGLIKAGSFNGTVFVVPYDSSRYRLAIASSTDGTTTVRGFVSSSLHGFNLTSWGVLLDFYFYGAGLSSSARVSDGYDGREVSFRHTSGTITGINPNANTVRINITGTPAYDSVAGWSATDFGYKIKTSGVMDFHTIVKLSNTNIVTGAGSYYEALIYKNGVEISRGTMISPQAGSPFMTLDCLALSVPCIVGDVIDVRIYSSINHSASTITAEYVTFTGSKSQTPQTISESERIFGSYDGTAGNIIDATDRTLICTTKREDTHGLYNTSNGRITANKAGTIDVTAVVMSNFNGAAHDLYIQTFKNGTLYHQTLKTVQAGSANQHQINDSIPVVAGDYIEVKYRLSAGSSNIATSNSQCYINFKYQK